MKIYIINLLIIILLIGCSSKEARINSQAIEEVENQDYIEAAIILRELVELNPNYLEGMVNYRNIYPIALEQVEDELEYSKDKNSVFKTEENYRNILQLKEGLYYMVPFVHKKLYLSLSIPTEEEIEKLQNQNYDLSKLHHNQKKFNSSRFRIKYNFLMSKQREKAYSSRLAMLNILEQKNIFDLQKKLKLELREKREKVLENHNFH